MDKWILKSKTIWGGILMAWPSFAQALDLPVALGTELDAAAQALFTLIGALGVVWGRIDAGGVKLVP